MQRKIFVGFVFTEFGRCYIPPAEFSSRLGKGSNSIRKPPTVRKRIAYSAILFSFRLSTRVGIQASGRGRPHSVADKKLTLRAVRQFMKLGRNKHADRRDSTTEDEDKYCDHLYALECVITSTKSHFLHPPQLVPYYFCQQFLSFRRYRNFLSCQIGTIRPQVID